MALRPVSLGFAALSLALVAAPASAHIALSAPLARSNDQIQLKNGPCGQTKTARTKTVTTFAPGETITVAWDETIDHPGHFRISFDPGGASFPDPTSFTDTSSGPTDLVDDIADKSGNAPIPYTQRVTLPNVECTNCTLQLIQVMTDKPRYGDGNDIYYQCADIVLARDAPPSDGGTVTHDAAIPTSDGGAAGRDASGDGSSGGCAMAGRGARSSVWLVFAAVGIALVRRARRRTGE